MNDPVLFLLVSQTDGEQLNLKETEVKRKLTILENGSVDKKKKKKKKILENGSS